MLQWERSPYRHVKVVLDNLYCLHNMGVAVNQSSEITDSTKWKDFALSLLKVHDLKMSKEQ